MEQKKGEFLVKLARESIERYLKGKGYPQIKIDEHEKKGGVFVTLTTYPENELRGCIGYIEPIFFIPEATIKAAIAAATQDPRFPPLSLKELDNITVEVTILSPPKLIKVKSPKDYLKKIKIGKHGLIVEKGSYRGLLLPQVPIEHKWDEEEFLCYTCMKAGLPPDCWFEESTKVYKFTGEIFKEEKPKGRVIKLSLQSCT